MQSVGLLFINFNLSSLTGALKFSPSLSWSNTSYLKIIYFILWLILRLFEALPSYVTGIHLNGSVSFVSFACIWLLIFFST